MVDAYILDFACRTLMLAIEVDGGHHDLQREADEARTRDLERRGWTVLRFWNSDIRANLDAVTETILEAIARASTHPRPLPSREGRNGR